MKFTTVNYTANQLLIHIFAITPTRFGTVSVPSSENMNNFSRTSQSNCADVTKLAEIGQRAGQCEQHYIYAPERSTGVSLLYRFRRNSQLINGIKCTFSTPDFAHIAHISLSRHSCSKNWSCWTTFRTELTYGTTFHENPINGIIADITSRMYGRTSALSFLRLSTPKSCMQLFCCT